MPHQKGLTLRARLESLGRALPPAVPPKGHFVRAQRAGALISVSGQVSRNADGSLIKGVAGHSLTTAEAVQAAQVAALNLLAQLEAFGITRISDVRSVLRLGVFVASGPEFNEHTAVGDGASDLLLAVFGEAGQHSRTALGVASLPGGAAVEVDAIFELNGLS